MRPVAQEQDHLRFPLNRVLGTEAQVRLMRVLAVEVSGPVSAPEAADLAGVTPAGARRALANLVQAGVVQRTGRGKSRQFRIREDDPLATALRSLFRAEEERFEDFIGALRTILGGEPAVRLAWLDALPVEAADPLHLGVVARTEEVAAVAREIRRQLLPIEARYDLTIELHSFTTADAPETSWDEVALLAGVPPAAGPASGTPVEHRHREERALGYSRRVAKLLEEEPTLRARALRHIERLLAATGPDMARHDLEEWRSILEGYPTERLAAFLASDSPRARRLRQSSPFLAVLTAEERAKVRRGTEEGEE